MSHMRTQIRGATKTAITGLVTTGANVFNGGPRPLNETQMPGLKVSCPLETSGVAAGGGSKPLLSRRAVLFIDIHVQKVDDYEDEVNKIAGEVEVALGNTRTLGGLVKNLEPKGFEIQFSDETQKPVAVGRLTYEALYFTSQGVPDQHQ